MSQEYSNLYFSDEFVISCGTVSIDLSKNLALLLYCRLRKQYHLPKGRKNVGESLEDAAVRETFEESGHRCRILPHTFVTLAPEYKVSQAHTEPLAVQQRRNWGPHRLIFWYLAEADSTETPAMGTQEAWEDFESQWVSMDEAAPKLAREEDQRIVARAVEAVYNIKRRKAERELERTELSGSPIPEGNGSPEVSN
ncbi:hypothetical protein AJ79_01785 [Helicocarpus griseus UAMH5409]|uniref:Nudix hydrolase domain-containing protein n=1 Tax=Helicocarpus griseus UAMH5409 TaxID=1447875 RepID=A0A2B7XXE5_9EURO|nr:hypothetical protein AJ79_01785 [Helicocarpus griseus UAMH5409]